MNLGPFPLICACPQTFKLNFLQSKSFILSILRVLHTTVHRLQHIRGLQKAAAPLLEKEFPLGDRFLDGDGARGERRRDLSLHSSLTDLARRGLVVLEGCRTDWDDV